MRPASARAHPDHDPGAAKGPVRPADFGGIAKNYTQIAGGTLDAERRKICAREHEQPKFWTRLRFAQFAVSRGHDGRAKANGIGFRPGGTEALALERARWRLRSDVRHAGGDPGTDILERGGEAPQHLVDLGRCDDHRGTESDAVAHGTRDQAVIVRALEESHPDLPDGLETGLRRLVRDEFDSRDQAFAAYLADQRMVGEACEPGAHMGADLPGVVDQSALLDDRQVFERDRGRDRMGARRIAVSECTE